MEVFLAVYFERKILPKSELKLIKNVCMFKIYSDVFCGVFSKHASLLGEL